jgi:hypothetical protein
LSAPIQLLQQVWDHCHEATGHSWLKLNHATHDTLSLAVRAGMRFDEDDFSRLFRNARDGGFRAGYWMGADTEWFYRLAVLYRNTSAWQTYEKYHGRKPFIVKGASICHLYEFTRDASGDGPCGDGLARLIVGAEFQWNGERVRVNSFNDRGGYLNAASYARTPYQRCPSCDHFIGGGGEEIRNRYRSTHADLRAARKEARKKPEAVEKVTA